ncbi:hypothetical protein SCLCIDRAFT_22032 [Scleroderma citrinum Foug A]|uniref:Uncharacterized protein n=1 Tax=Scleroderma citrinum Foug A TaxID=1036808 RepID=A0A0C2ZXH8_9AGAM|nr:hypothetical protein SCLCIDRAFT_22032 [Scleroderma citrinum Foug A]
MVTRLNHDIVNKVSSRQLSTQSIHGTDGFLSIAIFAVYNYRCSPRQKIPSQQDQQQPPPPPPMALSLHLASSFSFVNLKAMHKPKTLPIIMLPHQAEMIEAQMPATASCRSVDDVRCINGRPAKHGL